MLLEFAEVIYIQVFYVVSWVLYELSGVYWVVSGFYDLDVRVL